MTTVQPETDVPPSPEAQVSTAAARPQGRVQRLGGWLLVIALLIGIGLLSMRIGSVNPDVAGALNPNSAQPAGARALAELVRQQGVEVEIFTSRIAAASALGDDSTLVLAEPFPLSDDAVTALLTRADHVVLLSSSSRTLRLLELGTDTARIESSLSAGCELPEFAKVGSISPDRLFVPAAAATGCFRTAEGEAAVVRSSRDGRTVTLVEGTRILSNESLAEKGNAALGLALLAQRPHVVWYVPSFADTDIESSDQNLGDLSPAWVTPALLMLMLAGIAAIWWRGRRFGPLVSESLPVTVRASETMHGRARLTARAADAAHAGDAIRRGTLARLASRLALGPRASAEEIADAASDRLGVPRTSLYDLLAGSTPGTDAELTELARRLAELEDAVNDSAHPERNRP